MNSRPCPRAGQHKCLGTITVKHAKDLKRRRFCSRHCSAQGKLAAGWIPHRHMTAESRSRGAKIAGRISGQKRHRASVVNATAHCERYMPDSFRAGLTASQLARIRVLMARSFLRGYSLGIRKADTNRRYWAKKATAA